MPPVVHSAAGPFPAGPVRPRYREPHPVRLAGLMAGIGGGTLWLLLFGLFGRDLRSYLWYTVFATAVAWLAALLLCRLGDRGVAAGIAMSTAIGLAVAAGSAAFNWATSGDWPMW
ncbi:MAG TPA: hypothetical protein VF755_16970 [Catenuloplanes sp.]|jgi:hypothetical protein